MAIFQSSPSKKDPPPAPTPEPARPAPPPQANTDFSPATFPRTDAAPAAKESVIAADLTIEGKIEGAGNVRIAGRFKGDVNVQGDLTLERGAKLKGVIRAKKVIMAGELEGNIEAAARVELLESAALIGDIKAGTLTVAAGCKIRGHIDCGWENAAPKAAAAAAAAAPKVEPPVE
jgi:cytoskeletal protein CcmA (bactofilin family)